MHAFIHKIVFKQLKWQRGDAYLSPIAQNSFLEELDAYVLVKSLTQIMKR